MRSDKVKSMSRGPIPKCPRPYPVRKKKFDVLLTTFVQQENELAPNPLKQLYVPERSTTTTQPTVQNALPESNPNTNTKRTERRNEPKSQLIEFDDLPLVDTITQDPAAVSGQANQPQQQMKRIENKFYKSPEVNESQQSDTESERSISTTPKVIVIRPGVLQPPNQESAKNTQTAESLANNPLKNKLDSFEKNPVKPEPFRETQIENPMETNQKSNPILPLPIPSLSIPSDSGNPPAQAEAANSSEKPNTTQTKKPDRQLVLENELLADNPLKTLFAPNDVETSQAIASDLNQSKDREGDDATKKSIAKPTESKPVLDNAPLQKTDRNPSGSTIETPQIADSNTTKEGDQEVEPKKPGTVEKPRKKIKRLPANQMVAMGGWYRDDATLTIAYRQAGHADSVTVNWYDFVSSIPNAKENPMYSDFARLMTKSTSPGLCSSCHSVDQQPDHSLSMNWAASYRDISTRDFTRFSHRPHLVHGNANQCSTCHQILPGSNVMQNYVLGESKETRFDSSVCANGFAPMTKSNCVQCHNNRSKIQNCTQCHNYHVGSKVTRIKK